MEVQEQIKNIKADFRLFMNGAVSQKMREEGLLYKLNFGIELPRLKQIASQYPKNHDLAQALWKEEIRECKILAGLLQPVESFFPEIADIWVESIQYTELAEITTMTLFQTLPYAPAKCFEWMADEREMFQTCGFLLATRLFMQKMELSERAEAEFLDQVQVTIESENYQPRKAAILALKKYGMNSRANARKVYEILKSMEKQNKGNLKEIIEDIKFEIEYLL